MTKGKIYVYGGTGHGKTPAALGCGLLAGANGSRVVVIQFMRGEGLAADDFARRLEPEIKIFRFEKSEENFLELSKEKQDEEIQNIHNGLNFAKKVMNTGMCDMLILDEVLGLVDNQIITVEELQNVLSVKPEEMDVMMTGDLIDERICELADYVTEVRTVK